MPQYKTPGEYYFRLHHVRPRFKTDIENVLLFMAAEIVKLLPQGVPTAGFNASFNTAIRNYPGNAAKALKTINNWRTEISALFAFIIEDEDGLSTAGLRAAELAETQDLVGAFRAFLFLFQYPGAHNKAEKTLEMLEAGVRFKPAQYLLKVLKAAEAEAGPGACLLREEVCHCILNDLRCTRDNEDPAEAWRRIAANRRAGYAYDMDGDVVRYAGDILDYMEIANLLTVRENRKFCLNAVETGAVSAFIRSPMWFAGYDAMLEKRRGSLEAVNREKEGWFRYANTKLEDAGLATDLLAFLSADAEEYAALKGAKEDAGAAAFAEASGGEASGGEEAAGGEASGGKATGDETVGGEKASGGKVSGGEEAAGGAKTAVSAKEIGDAGESLVYSHECQRLKNSGRADLLHLIKRVPTPLAAGYDIQSLEADLRKRYIEVKTTVSSQPLRFGRIHLTPNEWMTAETLRERYFVYRLSLDKSALKLFILQDPVGLYKKDVIQMVPRNGADVSFGSDAGTEEALLSWAP